MSSKRSPSTGHFFLRLLAEEPPQELLKFNRLLIYLLCEGESAFFTIPSLGTGMIFSMPDAFLFTNRAICLIHAFFLHLNDLRKIKPDTAQYLQRFTDFSTL
jgi:hypothetical protein